MTSALMDSVRAALDRPWVLDLDVTIKLSPPAEYSSISPVEYSPV